MSSLWLATRCPVAPRRPAAVLVLRGLTRVSQAVRSHSGGAVIKCSRIGDALRETHERAEMDNMLFMVHHNVWIAVVGSFVFTSRSLGSVMINSAEEQRLIQYNNGSHTPIENTSCW